MWNKDWARLSTFYDYPPAIRKVIYTTNAIQPYTLKFIKHCPTNPNHLWCSCEYGI